jgi:HK97 family phage major capsid protein
MTLNDLHQEYTKLIAQMREAIDSNASEDTVANIKQELERTAKRIAQYRELEELAKAVPQREHQEQASAPAPQPTKHAARNVAELILQDAGVRQMIEQRQVGAKYIVQAVTIPTPVYTYETAANYVTPRPSVVGTLVSVGNRTNAITTYAQESTNSLKGSAATRVKGTAKPETNLTYTSKQSVAQIIAHYLKVSEQDLGDIQGLQTILQQRGIDMLAQAEEDQVINGNGTAPNLEGLLTVTGTQTYTKAGSESVLDALIVGAAKVATQGAQPSAVVVSLSTWASLMTLKGTDGQYIVPVTSAFGATTVRGLPIVASPWIADNKAIAGDSRYATLWRVGGIAVELARDGNDFTSNMYTLRIEERAALDVYRPEAFCVITLGA